MNNRRDNNRRNVFHNRYNNRRDRYYSYNSKILHRNNEFIDELNYFILLCRGNTTLTPIEAKETLDELLENAPPHVNSTKKLINFFGNSGISLAYSPIFNDNTDLLEFFIENGANVNFVNPSRKNKNMSDNAQIKSHRFVFKGLNHKQSLLHAAAIFSVNPKTIYILINAGADIKYLNSRAESAIECSIKANNSLSFKTLLECKTYFSKELRLNNCISRIKKSHQHPFKIITESFYDSSLPVYDVLNMILAFGQLYRQGGTYIDREIMLNIIRSVYENYITGSSAFIESYGLEAELIKSGFNLKRSDHNQMPSKREIRTNITNHNRLVDQYIKTGYRNTLFTELVDQRKHESTEYSMVL
jgi:hypothetical protein